ncbi:hypothetical protein AL468_00280 [Vibrio diabolicus]|uniref:SEFIR domain-containing protein n=1 Tax=Vibrio diabolicus TaxID=50719 RepID=A0ABM6S6P7_9VIBR|nr:hypothetical protein AL468_00280 [Vibrio diabolicus]
MVSNPKVFVSYSWDSEDHKTWVRELSERLIKNGIDVRLDQWHVAPGQSLTQFMEQEATSSDHVIIICTTNYNQKSTSRMGGVGYEQQIISGQIASGIEREKFIPLIRDGEFTAGDNCSIPPHFLGIYAIDMRDDKALDSSLETLLRAIYKEPLHKAPEIGKKPDFANIGHQVSESFEELRLATLDLDGYHLLSGLAQHHRTPETFAMPPEEYRRNIKEGTLVKLPFEISVPEDDVYGDISAERMWVILNKKNGPYYEGTLDSIPVCSDEQDFIEHGQSIIFLPEHVIDILDEKTVSDEPSGQGIPFIDNVAVAMNLLSEINEIESVFAGYIGAGRVLDENINGERIDIYLSNMVNGQHKYRHIHNQDPDLKEKWNQILEYLDESQKAITLTFHGEKLDVLPLSKLVMFIPEFLAQISESGSKR